MMSLGFGSVMSAHVIPLGEPYWDLRHYVASYIGVAIVLAFFGGCSFMAAFLLTSFFRRLRVTVSREAERLGILLIQLLSFGVIRLVHRSGAGLCIGLCSGVS